MNLKKLLKTIHPKTFRVITFGCRTNSAESNQLAQFLINQGFRVNLQNSKLFIVNTCAVTKKAQKESLRQIKSLCLCYPQSIIITTGCAHINALTYPNLYHLTNQNKHHLLKNQTPYTPKIKDKFSPSRRYLLRIQSGCNHFCSYCIVAYRRPLLWHLPLKKAVCLVNQAIKNNYQEIILTGTNLNLYRPGLNQLLKSLLQNTAIPLISFGSIPLNCINEEFLKIIKNSKSRIKNYLHVPIQSGSNKILKLMNRSYTQKQIFNTFEKLKQIPRLKLGTDIIVGFPGETSSDFQQTYQLCRQIGFSKIHVFRYSPRPDTTAQKLFENFPKIKNTTKIHRSRLIRGLTCQTTPPSGQKPA